ncbi:hypothetical protein HB364_21090 [Pseudoflavitalea sp. X16]|uniref:DNA double-strand break repair nuclease NurA n=1 Tax=Paraflavitalea devenefica TaxID=2716334 RepID=UPI00141F7885|nr:DNA double-strand break repair nuclease NurA [Paraflavitalea devenefica]NII27592.1 hypothetical protein [Paraflavitalea devenefica]
MNALEKDILSAFTGILDSLVDGEKYDSLPPRGPIDLPFSSVSDEELESIDQDIYGEDEEDDTMIDANLIKVIESPEIKEVKFPGSNELDGLNIIGITGANNRILTTSFHLILARSSIVNFKYTKGFDKPYFYTKSRDASAILVLDNNIFDSAYTLHTYNELINSSDSPIYDHLLKSKGQAFIFKYNYEKFKKAPSSQSLGLAVKFQHSLELLSIDDFEVADKSPLVCIKDGALFSNSSKVSDIQNGLQKLLGWSNKKKTFIALSSKITDSRVLINTLNAYPHLIEKYFPNQHITGRVINSFGTDVLLLKKILKPGYRTPLIEYVEKTRQQIIEKEGFEGLKPLTCYYHKRAKPYSFVRIEIPKFMWQENKQQVEFAISAAIWQFELGGDKPLVIAAASERCILDHDRTLIEQQMKAAFDKKKLGLVEF